MKRLFLVTFVIILLSTMILGGCAQAPTPTATQAPATTQAPASVKPVEIKWTIVETDSAGVFQDMHRELAKQVAEKTQGRVTLKIFWGGQLGKITDYLKMVSEGSIAQGGTLIGTFHQWDIPFWTAAGMPFLTKGYREASKATWELGKEWAAMQEQLKSKNLKMLAIAQGHETTIGTKNPINSLDQLKGQKMWIVGYWQAMAEYLGITNVPLGPADVYDSLSKGVITGYLGVTYQSSKWQKFYDLIRNVYSLRYGGQTLLFLTVNSNVWSQISAQDQKAIEDISNNLWFNTYPQQMDKELLELVDFYKTQGVKEYDLSADDAAKITKAGPDLIWGTWKKTASERGLPADEWLQRYQAKVASIRK